MRGPYVYTIPSDTDLEPVQLTQRQIEVLRAIDDLAVSNGYAPTCVEISQALNPRVSRQGAWFALSVLKGKSLCTWTYGVHRSIRLTPEGRVTLTAIKALPETQAQAG